MSPATSTDLLSYLVQIEDMASQITDANNKRDAIAYEETLSFIKMLSREAVAKAAGSFA